MLNRTDNLALDAIGNGPMKSPIDPKAHITLRLFSYGMIAVFAAGLVVTILGTVKSYAGL